MSLRHRFHRSAVIVALLVSLCAHTTQTDVVNSQNMPGIGPSEKIELPRPFATPSASNNSKVIGWPQARMPTAAPGFEVSLFAEDLDYPRLAYVLPNEDVLVVEADAQKSVNRITLFRDTNKDGKPDHREIFLTGLNMPYGMLLLRNWFYVGNTDGLVRYPYQSGQRKIDRQGEKILDLPSGGHYTRNLTADRARQKITSQSVPQRTWMKTERIVRIQGGRQFYKSIRTAAVCACLPAGCEILSVWIGSQKRIFYGPSSTSGMDWATIWSLII